MFDDLSACDFDGEFTEKFHVISERTKPKTGVFESSAYFESLFPSFKIQKPGKDLYGKTMVILSIIAIFVFLFYG